MIKIKKLINYDSKLVEINKKYFELKKTGLTRNKVRNFILDKFIVFFNDHRFPNVRFYQPKYQGIVLPLVWDSSLGFRIYMTKQEFKLPTTEKNNIFNFIEELYVSLPPESIRGIIETFVVPKFEPDSQVYYQFQRFSDVWERIDH